MEFESDHKELEEQFILRLPLEESEYIRNLLKTKPGKMRKNLKIHLDVEKNIGSVRVGKKRFFAYLRKLPTIIESYKTNLCNDRANLYKTADICHILECYPEEQGVLKKEFPHGYTPPLKNVKKKRFRKTLVNPEIAQEQDEIVKELYYLLSTDMDATTTRYEVLYEENSGKTLGLLSDIESD